MQHAASAGSVGLVEDDVAEQVLVGEKDTDVVRGPRERERAIRALPDRLDRTGA